MTSGSASQRSIQLSYGCVALVVALLCSKKLQSAYHFIEMKWL